MEIVNVPPLLIGLLAVCKLTYCLESWLKMKDKEAFRSHELWQLVDGIKASEYLPNLPSDTRKYLIALLEDLNKRRERTNPFYVNESSLSNIYNYISNINDWISNPDNVSIIDSYIDECFRELASSWPANNGRMIADINKDTYESFMDDAQAKLNTAVESVDKAQELESQFEAKKEECEKSLDELKSSFIQAITEAKDELVQSKDNLVEKYELEIKDRTDKTDSTLAAIEKNFTESLQQTKKDTESILDEVEKTANAISGTAMTTDYARYAKDKEFAVEVYDGLAIAFAIIGIALVAFVLTSLKADETSASVFKLAVSVASFTVSGFLFKRGTYNQREAKAARRTELTLREYKPFIANLSDDDKKRITNRIAERVFIKGEIGDKDEKTVSSALLDRGPTDKQIASIAALIKALTKEPVS